MKKIGIFGGSFNPPHLGHTGIVNHFIENLNLDFCIVIPAYISPFKNDEMINPESNSLHILNMVKLAFSKYKKIVVSDYELNKKGISYTYETLKHFKLEYIDSEIYLLIGTDQALLFKKWKNWEWILDNTQLVIVNREDELSIDDLNVINENLSRNGKQPIILNSPAYIVSSRIIRSKIQSGDDISKYLSPDVINYIKSSKLYI